MNAPAVRPVKYLVCVNDSEHSHIALKFAYTRAKKRGSRLDMLHVIEPTNFEGIVSIANKIREENFAKGEAFLARMADEVQQAVGITPSLILKEGSVEEAIIKAVQDDPDLNMLLLGASTDHQGRHVHISALVKIMGDKLLIPMMIVPGNLTDQQIEELA